MKAKEFLEILENEGFLTKEIFKLYHTKTFSTLKIIEIISQEAKARKIELDEKELNALDDKIYERYVYIVSGL